MFKTLFKTLVTLSFVGFYANAESVKTPLQQITVAQWGQEKYLIYLPLYVAMEKGLFAKNGLEISLKFSGNDDQTFATVISGDAQFGIGDPVFAAIAQEKGFPARVIGVLVNGIAIWGLSHKEAKVIDKISDLEGLNIGTFPEPSTTYTLMNRMIQENSFKNTSIVQAPIGSQLALLENGDVDIAMELEPAASLAEARGYKVIYSPSKFHGAFAFTGVTTTKAYLDGNANITKKFLLSLEEAMQLSHNDHNIAIEVGKKIFPKLEGKIIENAVNRMLNENTYPQHIAMSEEAWDNAIEVRRIAGDIKDVAKTKPTVDNSYAPIIDNQK